MQDAELGLRCATYRIAVSEDFLHKLRVCGEVAVMKPVIKDKIASFAAVYAAVRQSFPEIAVDATA